MELQPIVGTECASCHEKILVDADGKNCKRCGLAVHRACSKAHRETCAGKPALAEAKHDYDEVPTLAWTPRLVTAVAISAFATMFGLAMYLGPILTTPSGEPTPMNKTRIAIASVLIAFGVVMAAGAIMFERSKQQR